MKIALPLLLLFVAITSCKNTWSSEDKDAFHRVCMENAVRWAPSEEKAKTYCDCVLRKIIEKYPHEEEALEHIDQLGTDTSFRACRAAITPAE